MRKSRSVSAFVSIGLWKAKVECVRFSFSKFTLSRIKCNARSILFVFFSHSRYRTKEHRIRNSFGFRRLLYSELLFVIVIDSAAYVANTCTMESTENTTVDTVIGRKKQTSSIKFEMHERHEFGWYFCCGCAVVVVLVLVMVVFVACRGCSWCTCTQKYHYKTNKWNILTILRALVS